MVAGESTRSGSGKGWLIGLQGKGLRIGGSGSSGFFISKCFRPLEVENEGLEEHTIISIPFMCMTTSGNACLH